MLCPGCGLERGGDSLAATRFRASEACWELYGELSAYTLTRGREFIHQHVVDAYGAQHGTSSLGVAFSLIGLCLAIEKGYSGRQVQLVHMELGRAKRDWPRFEMPTARATVTVADVVAAPAGELRDAAIFEWARAVWDLWSAQREWTRGICVNYPSKK